MEAEEVFCSQDCNDKGIRCFGAVSPRRRGPAWPTERPGAPLFEHGLVPLGRSHPLLLPLAAKASSINTRPGFGIALAALSRVSLGCEQRRRP